MIVCALYHLKGGVGKTTAAVNLAYLASQTIGPTLLCDLDPQGAASFLLRSDSSNTTAKKILKGDRIERLIVQSNYENLFLLPASVTHREMDIRLDRREHPKRGFADAFAPLRNKYELLVIDSPPSISLQADNIFFIADYLFVPIIPSPLSIESYSMVRKRIQEKKRRKPRTFGFYALVDRRKKMHRKLVDTSSDNDTMFRSFIPYSSVVEEMSIRRAPIFAYANTSRPATAYRELWGEMMSLLVPNR